MNQIIYRSILLINCHVWKRECYWKHHASLFRLWFHISKPYHTQIKIKIFQIWWVIVPVKCYTSLRHSPAGGRGDTCPGYHLWRRHEIDSQENYTWKLTFLEINSLKRNFGKTFLLVSLRRHSSQQCNWLIVLI